MVLFFGVALVRNCLQQLPEFHKRVKDIQVFRYWLLVWKMTDVTGKLESAKLNRPLFMYWPLENGESSIYPLYDITSTPTYYIFGQGKTHCWHPEDYEEVVKFF